ncbi:hypothetical protein SMACR_04589 [Sordaria macrospora]|uniref:WGS project CABT00000000 data, contig 2.20 n=2 Tax=Sordaria macrospora TaxID=5147 RepID=F7W1W7_SORMK|nr:uncharacterized protein SMAC_04589 [Sordaria macrospora k-hell]KAA8636019.1 hypothetical protein SMACR_04589 [Sordaria macrospora]WPJ58390.1 hypothetical protein SMAC4_04589 [Sordaria macrospora]CCC11604.1 unnamed protein product [Sordaria macrospora k-hell]
MSTRQPSRVVFVGNIPYGLTEEQITEIFSGAGRVLNFRLVYDRETGRPKGFGFAEFPDYDSAASAVRNLNDHEIMGRKLRVDFSNETFTDQDSAQPNQNTSGGYNAQAPNGGGYNAAPPASAAPPALGPLPQGKDLPPDVSCTDAISRTLNTLPPAQLLDILQQMKTLATNDPARATELLNQAPQLSYAIFQALLIMGLVSPDAINSVLENPGAAAAAAPPPMGAPVVPNPVGGAPYGAYPGPTATPPVAPGPAAGGYAAPPVAAAPVPASAAAAPAAMDPDAMIRAILELPQETVDQLAEPERQQVLAIRAQFAAQGGLR